MNDDDNQRSRRRLTAKQEAYVLKVAEEGLTLSAAYRAVFKTSKMKDKTVYNEASKLASRPDIAARISEIRGEAARIATVKLGYTLADAMAQADTAFEKAEQFEQAGAMVSAATLKAKLAGHLVERRETRTGPLEDADIKELLRLRAMLQAEMDLEAAAEEMAGAPPAPVADPRGGNRPTTRTLQ